MRNGSRRRNSRQLGMFVSNNAGYPEPDDSSRGDPNRGDPGRSEFGINDLGVKMPTSRTQGRPGPQGIPDPKASTPILATR